MSKNDGTTSSKRFEERLEHLNVVLRAIRNVNQLITQETDRERLLKGVCTKLVETRGYHHAWIALFDEAGRLISSAAAGFNGGFAVLADRLELGWLPGCGHRTLSAGHVVVIKDPVTECGDCPLVSFYPDSNRLSTTLRYKDKTYGIITVAAPTGFVEDPEELDLMAELAGDIAFALYKFDLEEKRLQAEEALRQAHDQLERRVEERTVELSQTNKRLQQEIEERRRIQEELDQYRQQLEQLVIKRTVRLIEANHQLEQEIRERQRIAEGLQQSQERYKMLFERMLDGHAVHEIICDETGRPIDYRFLDINPAFEAMTGLGREIIGKTVLEVMPGTEQYWIDIYGQVALTGQPARFENYSGEVGQKWFEVLAYSPGQNQFAVLFQEITQRKQMEEALRQSEVRFRTLVESIDDIVFTLDDQQRHTGVYGRWLENSGLSPEFFIGKTARDIMGVEAAKAHETATERALAGESVVYEWSSSDPDGSTSSFQTSLSPLKNAQAEVVGLVGIGRDITQLKQVEAAVRMNEARYRALFEQANDAIFLINKRDQIIDVNQRACDLLGYTPEELLTMTIPDIQAPEVRGQTGTVIKEELRQYEGAPFEAVGLHRDGTRIPVEVTTSEVADQQQELVISICRDITERKQAEEEIHRRNRDLTLLNRVVAATAASLEPHVMLEIACRELALAFNLPEAAAALWNEDRTEAVVVAEYLTQDQSSTLPANLPLSDNPLFQHLLLHKVPLIIEDAQNDPRLDSIQTVVRQRGIISLLILPLIIHEEVVGMLELDAITARSFSPEEVDLAQNVAAQVSGALARAQLEEERRKLQDQFHQAQKMEALGRLTGGVAHDFNNLLTAINGFAELVQMRLAPDDPQYQLVGNIINSGQRAANLVRQLLAFSRKQLIEPKILDLNLVVADMDKMLRRIIGEDIELKTILTPELWPVKLDPAQLEQIIVNLAVNARDAMPNGGRLTIETANVILDPSYAATHLEAAQGQHVLLAISDSGMGMDQEILTHVFEPFFTTKELGRGTGLGLATVYGIVKQNSGTIQVYSEIGVGTTFKIYLPYVKEIVSSTIDRTQVGEEIPGGDETILLVEDDANVRKLVQRVLKNFGYNLLVAEDGPEALQLAAGYNESIQLLLTDVVMPGLSGKTLAEELKQTRPNLKILFMSGYTDNAIAHHGVLDPGTAFVQKPFSATIIAYKIREVLDG